MNWFLSALLTGAIAFSATNIDDILFLTIFFSQTRHRWHVVVGQYLAFTVLLLISLVGFFGGRIVPHDWIRWLGVAPILLGLKKLFEKPQEISNPRSSILAVATVTFINGADNIGLAFMPRCSP